MELLRKVPCNILLLALGAALVVVVVWPVPQTRVDYNAQVKPIINKRCIT